MPSQPDFWGFGHYPTDAQPQRNAGAVRLPSLRGPHAASEWIPTGLGGARQPAHAAESRVDATAIMSQM